MKIVEKPWGNELWLVNTELYCSKILTLKDGVWSSEGRYHYHKKKDETFFVLSGEIILDIGGTERLMRPTDTHRIYPGIRHRFKSQGVEAKVLEISTYHNDNDSYRIDKL